MSKNDWGLLVDPDYAFPELGRILYEALRLVPEGQQLAIFRAGCGWVANIESPDDGYTEGSYTASTPTAALRRLVDSERGGKR